MISNILLPCLILSSRQGLNKQELTLKIPLYLSKIVCNQSLTITFRLSGGGKLFGNKIPIDKFIQESINVGGSHVLVVEVV